MEDIRQSIKTQSEFLKELDMAYLKNSEEANTREKSLVTMLKSKEPTHDNYTEYMEKLDREFQIRCCTSRTGRCFIYVFIKSKQIYVLG